MSNPQTKEKDKKVRVFELAKELALGSKDLVSMAKDLGFAGVTNQLSGLTNDQVDALKDRAKKGPKPGAAPAPIRQAIPPAAKLDSSIKTLPKGVKPAAPPRSAPPTPELEIAPIAAPEVAPVDVQTPLPVEEPTPIVVEEQAPEVPAAPMNVIPSNLGASNVRNLGGSVRNLNRPAAPASKPPAPVPEPPPPPKPTAGMPPPRPSGPPPALPPRPAPGAPPGGTVLPPRGPGGPPPGGSGPQRPNFLSRAPQPPPPAKGATAPSRHGPGGGGTPNRSGGGPPKPGAPAPPRSAGPPKPGQSMRLTPEMLQKLRESSARGQRVDPRDLAKQAPAPNQPGRPSDPGRPAARPAGGPGRGPAGEEDDEEKKKAAGGVIGRDSRHRGRQGSGRGGNNNTGRVDRGAVVIGAGGTVETIEEKFGSRKGPRQALLNKMRRRQALPVKKEGRIEITPPINVRSLSEAIGMKSGELGKRLLKETGQLYGVNSTIELSIAQLIAAEQNIELVLKKQETAEEKLIRDFEDMMTNLDPEKLRPRPPIVTIMGHVDHGKTSLLDKIRSSKVVDTEIGGITQVIRAWSVVHKIEDPETGEKVVERPITFLDTPGHEAFTKMRARGANVTDIAVIVVAATDGVMPQTEEAIAHARAAEVRIIIAINKVDMPNANVDRTRRQLYGLNLLPDDMGGDTQFVETSAATGQGIDDLLTAILLEAELNLADELQADPDRPATGTCLEAYMSSDEGVMATVLVQQGTLERGDILLCGSTFGRVRAMYNDLGRPVQTAGPSTPVRITGLAEVPNADDPFYVVEELATAQEIAEIRRDKELEASRNKFAPVSLDSLTAAKTKAKITELKVILKAEARGSVEAIRKELEKLVHEEVRTRVLHAAIGAISESDVQLALTSPEDTLVVGFNVTADDAALRLAEDHNIHLREYQIIYNLVDDVKAALEGRLKPIEEVVHLGRAVVRATFKVGKVGVIAGCHVTSGSIERNARIRVIREGIVIYPPADKVVGLDSLKRFKEDVKEVREGFECGLKITGYNDIKVGDVIEAFKIEIKQRTL
ncbi:MAG TPA: translation initiation factor IF-2 [Urbifossiella sp.]|nr:translation initiation factor IF-2 [Urbifossiella sp.]